MGALQVQSNGDGAAAEELFPDPGYAEVDPTGRYGRVRSIDICSSSSSLLVVFFFRHAVVVDRGTNKSCFPSSVPTTDSLQYNEILGKGSSKTV